MLRVVRSVCIVFMLTAALCGCAELEQEAKQLIDQIDPQAVQKAQDLLRRQGVDVEEATARAPIITRALVWVKLQVPYNQKATRDGYRTDCSGFVSYAWGLKNDKGQPISPDTVALGKTYGIDIAIQDIQPGDVVNNKRSGNDGHVIMFVNWSDQTHTKFIAYEENGGHGQAVQTELTIEYLKDGTFTIKDYQKAAPGPYFAQKSPYVP